MNGGNRKHVLITGTGRAGTTLLVRLLSSLGLDTGYRSDSELYSAANAGLEWDIREENAPYVVKNPAFCDYAEEVLNDDRILIEHVFIPIRKISDAAESRRRVQKLGMRKKPLRTRVSSLWRNHIVEGGLWYGDEKASQEEVLTSKLMDLLIVLSKHNVPVTMINFPQLTENPDYLYKKLSPLLDGISYDEFVNHFSGIVDTGLVHKF